MDGDTGGVQIEVVTFKYRVYTDTSAREHILNQVARHLMALTTKETYPGCAPAQLNGVIEELVVLSDGRLSTVIRAGP